MLAKMLLDHLNNPPPLDAPEPEPSKPAEPLHEHFVRAWSIEPSMDELLDAAYRAALPPASTRARYRDLYHAFRDFLRSEHGIEDALPAHGALVSNWLLQLAIEGRPLSEVKEAAHAVEYFHKLHRGDVFIDAALAAAADIDDDDGGGGGKKIEDTTATEAPVAIEQQLPLAAAEPANIEKEI
jgi:hypothetical protein